MIITSCEIPPVPIFRDRAGHVANKNQYTDEIEVLLIAILCTVSPGLCPAETNLQPLDLLI
jgi:hypothetical protein